MEGYYYKKIVGHIAKSLSIILVSKNTFIKVTGVV